MIRTSCIHPRRFSAILAVFLLSGATAKAQGQEDDLIPSLPEDSDAPEDEVVVDEGTEAEQLEELKDRIEALEARLAQSEEFAIQDQSSVVLEGYADFGAFWPLGDGVGFIQDLGNEQFPRYEDQFAWVFLGDILATTVNSRGEAADLGEPPGRPRFDSVNSQGAPSFILNEANLTLRVGIGSSARLTTSINFVPRSGEEFALGDFFDLAVAQLEWIVSEDIPTSVFVGKVEPVFGIEYKDRMAKDRFGITPSLIGRYLIGTQLGLKVRSKLANDWLIFAAAVTNGSAVQEQFHFYDEIDSNYGKTLTGRLALNIPMLSMAPDVFSAPLEIGFSGQWGAQDKATDSSDSLFFIGPDIEYRGVNFRLKGQLILGEAPGRPEDGTFGLDLKLGGYLELNYLFTGMYGLLARVGVRDAEVTLGDERLYLTKSWRITLGGRIQFNEHMILKAEFLKNFEYGGIQEFDNDILTSSLLVVF